ncbi:MAG: glutamate--cysteine ligase, partial [Polyangiaceae bacterium]
TTSPPPAASNRPQPLIHKAAAVTTTESLDPIRRRDDLLAPFFEACKPRASWRIGPETEKFGVFDQTLAPVHYTGERSVSRVLDVLSTAHGWVPDRETDGGPIIALVRQGASITLEPGGQLELSGGQSEDVHHVNAEFRDHLRELGPISRELGIRWLGVGFHPFAQRADFEWVPKQRYRIMREYLPTRGGHAIDMMLRTCTVQVNLDYASEADAMRKMRVALALSPTTTAMFANSPWKEGRAHGGLTYRGRVWLDVDPDRTGLSPALWRQESRFDDQVEWALDVPMFLFKRAGRAVANTGQTFRQFMTSGFEGHSATRDDWLLHMNTLFPEVRLKKTIELRGADMQSTEMACALPALWAGVLYDDRALAEAEALIDGWTHDEVAQLRPHVCRDGLRAVFRGRPLAEVAERLVAIGEGGLQRRARIDPSTGSDERAHLVRLRTLVGQARTPADILLEKLRDQDDVTMRTALDRVALI